MPANLESMAYFGATPWHGLGTRLSDEETVDVDRCIVASGLDWPVELAELVVGPNGPPDIAGNLVDHRLTYRGTDRMFLGVVGPRYTPLQNRSAFEWFQPFLDDGQARLHTAGSLDDGKKVWVLAQISGDPITIAKNDDVLRFILLSNSHDGTTAVRVGYTPIRVVCANTLAMAHSSDASRLIRLRHSQSVEENLKNVRKIMDVVNKEFAATADQFRALTRRDINQKDLVKYVKEVLKVSDDEDVKTRTQNTIDDILRRFERDKSKKRTVWVAYNAVNEWMNYERGHNEKTRLHSLWFGDSERMNKRALDLAVKLVA